MYSSNLYFTRSSAIAISNFKLRISYGILKWLPCHVCLTYLVKSVRRYCGLPSHTMKPQKITSSTSRLYHTTRSLITIDHNYLPSSPRIQVQPGTRPLMPRTIESPFYRRPTSRPANQLQQLTEAWHMLPTRPQLYLLHTMSTMQLLHEFNRAAVCGFPRDRQTGVDPFKPVGQVGTLDYPGDYPTSYSVTPIRTL